MQEVTVLRTLETNESVGEPAKRHVYLKSEVETRRILVYVNGKREWERLDFVG